jgi:hypothetical protein
MAEAVREHDVMKRKTPAKAEPRRRHVDLDDLIEQITVDACGDAEQLRAFRQAFEDEIPSPCSAFVIGEPVTVLQFDFDGNERRGLIAKCRREDGSRYTVSAADVMFPDAEKGALYTSAYRKWLGLAPHPKAPKPRTVKARNESQAPSLEPSGPVELVVLSVQKLAVRCRYASGHQRVTLRTKRFWNLAPGEIVTVRPNKTWSYADNPYLSGEIESTRTDAAALGLTPLKLEEHGMWKPAEEYWGEDGEPVADWAKPIVACGPRPQFEMEQVLPRADPDDPFSDPITESNDRKDAGDLRGAEKLLHFAVWTPMLISETWISSPGRYTPFGTTRWAFASES